MNLVNSFQTVTAGLLTDPLGFETVRATTPSLILAFSFEVDAQTPQLSDRPPATP